MITRKQIKLLTVEPEAIVVEPTRAYRKPSLVIPYARMRGAWYMGAPRRGEAGARESLHKAILAVVSGTRMLLPYPLSRELAWIDPTVARKCSDKTIRGLLESLFFHFTVPRRVDNLGPDPSR